MEAAYNPTNNHAADADDDDDDDDASQELVHRWQLDDDGVARNGAVQVEEEEKGEDNERLSPPIDIPNQPNPYTQPTSAAAADDSDPARRIAELQHHLDRAEIRAQQWQETALAAQADARRFQTDSQRSTRAFFQLTRAWGRRLGDQKKRSGEAEGEAFEKQSTMAADCLAEAAEARACALEREVGELRRLLEESHATVRDITRHIQSLDLIRQYSRGGGSAHAREEGDEANAAASARVEELKGVLRRGLMQTRRLPNLPRGGHKRHSRSYSPSSHKKAPSRRLDLRSAEPLAGISGMAPPPAAQPLEGVYARLGRSIEQAASAEAAVVTTKRGAKVSIRTPSTPSTHPRFHNAAPDN